MLDFELKPLKKYTVSCAKCAEYRQKSSTRSLTVYRDEDKFIRWQCWHPGCEWNERQWTKDPEPNTELQDFDLGITMSSNIIHIDSAPKLPNVWWYADVDGIVQYGVKRVDTGKIKTNGKKEKIFKPVNNQGEDIPSWPAGKVLFNAHKLKDFDKILIVEGEKTATAAQELTNKMAVVTWRGGAGNIGTGDWQLLKNKTVYLWPDNDKDGSEAMRKVADLLTNSEVYLVDVSFLAPGQDLADDVELWQVKDAILTAKLVHKPVDYTSSLFDIHEQEHLLSNKFKIGWDVIDSKVNLPTSGVVVIEGRTGHAKTGTAISVGSNHLSRGGRVHFFSYEIPASRVYNRFVRSLFDDLPSGTDVRASEQYELVGKWLEDKQLFIYDQGKQLDLTKVKEILSDKAKPGDLVIIDYAQILPVKGADIRDKLIAIMNGLRIQANTQGLLVLLLSQLTPDYSNPLYDAPRDAKDIHMSAETVLRVWNKDNNYSNHPLYDDIEGNFAMHVIKNRDGEGGQIFGFEWKHGAYLMPNGDVSVGAIPKKQENRSTLALETIAGVLQRHLGEI